MSTNYLRSSLDKIWLDLLNSVQKENVVDITTFDRFLKDSKLHDINDEKTLAIIEVPMFLNKSAWERNKNLIDYIELYLKNVVDNDIKINILTTSDLKQVIDEENITRTHEQLKSHLLSEYTFDNFVVGKCNREAQIAALKCAEEPNTFINPLFIYGNSGLGKTHLLHAIGNYVKQHNPDKKVLYISGDDFIQLIISSFAPKTTEEIKSKICQLDYLLIDDIQRIAMNNASQEVFFNVYNKLIRDKKQIVITSDLHPKELNQIENRLVNRFSAGLSLCINSPEFDTAVAILKKKMEGRINDTLIMSQEAVEYIALSFNSDVRKLEGALNEIIFKSIMYKPEIISLEFAKEVFKGDPTIKSETKLTPAKIKRAVCDFYGLTKIQLESKSRTSNIANARHIAIYLCRKHLDMPFAKIGFEFSNRDHSTVMSSYDKIKTLLKEREDFKDAINAIEKKLGF